MPISSNFLQRLRPSLHELVERYGTPFHIYDEAGIVSSHQCLTQAFKEIKFKQFFAVKALPNPTVLKTLHSLGSGMDCASITELELVARSGISGTDVLYTANNSSIKGMKEAIRARAWITMDDITCLDDYTPLPDVVTFRVALGNGNNQLIGGDESKFGVPLDSIFSAYKQAIALGAKRFGIHQMTCANTLDVKSMLDGACRLIDLAAEISKELNINFEYINVGGGPGIPYRPNEEDFNIEDYANKIISLLKINFEILPELFMECGRFISGSHGVLVSRVQTVCNKYRPIIGLDASMASLMRPALYKDAYHHITLPFNNNDLLDTFDVVGSLCENIDKFAICRELPIPNIDDIVLIHDTGAHGASMGFNYNGHLRPAEILLKTDGRIRLIRRHENFMDYISTIIDDE